MSNPALNENVFNSEGNIYVDASNAMTVNGTAAKSIFLLVLVVLAGLYSWQQFAIGNMGLANALMAIGLIVGFILALIISFARKTAPYLSPIYALAEGLALGGISAATEAQFPGIVFQAVLGSFAAMFTMLALFMSKVITVTDKLRAVIMISTISIGVLYLVSFILSFFHISVPFLFDSSPISIGISVLVIIVAAFNLLLDFDIIERGVASFAPKYFEWYCSFGLLVTLVWLYIEILRLLSKLQKR